MLQSRPIRRPAAGLVLVFFLGLTVSATPVAASDVCDGQVEELPFEVAPPQEPRPYRVPLGAVKVDTTEELQDLLSWNAVQNANPLDIVLADGVYSPVGLEGAFLSLHGSHRLWAENVGQAVLEFGIHIGANANPNLQAGVELHGLRFELHDDDHAAVANPAHRSAAVYIWGSARGVKIEDSFFYGGGEVDLGIAAYNADGLEVRRVEIEAFNRFGILTSREGGQRWRNEAILEDIVVQNVGDNEWAWSFPEDDPDYDPAYPNFDPQDPYVPSQEIGIWVGVPGRLSRARIRDIARGGVVAAGQAYDAVMEDLDVDEVGWRDTGPNAVNGAGLYFDNTVSRSIYRRFCVGPHTAKGLVSEWDNYTFPRGLYNRIEDGLLESSLFGIFLDQGTVDTTVARVYFRNASWAGLTIFNNVWPGDHKSTIEVLYEDVFDVGLPGCLVTAHHPNIAPFDCTLPPPDPQNP